MDVVTEDTKAIVNLVNCLETGPELDPLFGPGERSTDEGKALLGTPHGVGIAYPYHTLVKHAWERIPFKAICSDIDNSYYGQVRFLASCEFMVCYTTIPNAMPGASVVSYLM